MEKNKIKILAIDDNKDNLTSVKALIREAFPDSITLTATNGGIGIELAETEDPHVILLDVVMPGMDGFEVCQKLKSNPRTRDIPVVFLTALKGEKESRIRALEVGADAFLAKPIDETELTAQIRAMQKIKDAGKRKTAEKETLAQLVSEQTRELQQTHVATLNLLEDLREENETRMKSEEAARESEEKWRSLVNFSPDFIALHDLEGRFLFLNHYAEGFTEKEVIGSSVYQYQSPESVKLFRSYTEIALNTWTPQHFEHVAMGENGTLKTYDEYLIPIRGKDQEINIMAIARDITERKQAEELIRQYAGELEIRVAERTADLSRTNSDLARALRSRDDFLASVSHELRTPLTGILGLSEALQLKTYGDLSDKQYRAIKAIEESGRHLLALINDILDLSKIEAGKVELQFAPCSLADICLASLQLIKGMAQQKNQDVQYSPATGQIIVYVDARRLKQILVNLLGNAIKFTPQNGELGLEVQANEVEGNIKLTVWDKGIGIKAEDLHKLFNPFMQIDSGLAREYSGTGLGLSLVQRLTEMHNGGIEVESDIGKGSRFTITLPWSPQDSAPISNTPQRSTGRLSSSAIPPERSKSPLVMFADDNEIILQSVADFLEAKQYRVMKVRSGIELLESAPEFHPDIVLMDIQMPGMDGLETIRGIRSHADPLIAEVPVIAVTALAMPGDRDLCLRAGANDYISKPMELKELVVTIEKLLEDKQ